MDMNLEPYFPTPRCPHGRVIHEVGCSDCDPTPQPSPKKLQTIDEVCGQPEGSFAQFFKDHPDPDAYIMEQKFKQLEQEKQTAIDQQAFEYASKVCDEIKALKSQPSPNEAGEKFEDLCLICGIGQYLSLANDGRCEHCDTTRAYGKMKVAADKPENQEYYKQVAAEDFPPAERPSNNVALALEILSHQSNWHLDKSAQWNKTPDGPGHLHVATVAEIIHREISDGIKAVMQHLVDKLPK